LIWVKDEYVPATIAIRLVEQKSEVYLMKKMMVLTAAIVMAMGVTAIPEAQAGAEAKCKACHDLSGGAHKVGPSLKGVLGRKAGSTDFGKYSDSMKKGGWTWDEANLRTFLTDTKSGIETLAGDGAKTKMKFKISGASLDEVIAFLKTYN